MLNSIVEWVVHLMELLGAPGVGVAVFLENVFPPIPSEVVLPLAGFTSSQGKMNVFAAFIWATVGSVVGAFFLYWVGQKVGANRLRHIAEKMWLVEPEDVDKALHWFHRFGPASILFGRLVPGVRSLISIPAGLDRMPLHTFGLYTFIGSAVWNAVLIYLGVLLRDNWEQVAHVIDQYSTVVYILILLLLAYMLFRLVRRAQRRKKEGRPLL